MNPAFLVDGVTEKNFVQLVCPGKRVQLIGLNGNTVKTEAMAKKISSLIKLYKGRHYPIIILVDLEDRQIAFKDFAQSLSDAISANDVLDEFFIGVADRMIENWMLADHDQWPNQELPETTDGFSGVNKIKSIRKSYDKAANGPKLLLSCRPSAMRTRSPSFAHFFDSLPFKCAWLKK